MKIAEVPLPEGLIARLAEKVLLAPAVKIPPGESGPEGAVTDLCNAERLVARHGRDLRYCHPWRRWLVWDGTRWKSDDVGAVDLRAKETIRAMYGEAAGIIDEKERQSFVKAALRSEAGPRLQAMISLAESELGIPVLPDELDRDAWLLNVKNGTLDLRTGELRPPRREDMLTRLAPAAYDPAAVCPRWEAFLDRIMAGNDRLIGFLQRAVGYSLTASTREQVFFLLHGTGANGKSVFLTTLQAALGDYAGQTAPGLLLEKKGERHPTEVADLLGKRLVVATETDSGQRLAEGLVKQVSGGDPVKARRMREDFWQFNPTHKLWLATNHKPRVRGTDYAIWRRIRLIPFNVTIPPEEQDRTLPEKLREELSGILRWAVEGCLAWQRQGLDVPDEVAAATEAYRAEQDVLAGFLAECCIVNPLAKAAAKELYRVYVGWCEESGERPMAQRNFGMQLGERGFENHRGTKTGGSIWRGLGLRTEGTEGTDPDFRINKLTLSRKTLIPKIGSDGSVGSVAAATLEDIADLEEGEL